MDAALPAGPDGEVLRVSRQPRRRVPLSFYIARQPITCSMEDDRAYGCNIGDPGEGDITNKLHTGQSSSSDVFGVAPRTRMR
jgi:hypothetical protein